MKPKRKKSRAAGDDDDRISYLSDEILCHILSFIPTIDSITTCILSKRWEHLWKYVPKLNFDDFSLDPVQRVTFANIVNRALSHHTKLSQLSLRCEQISELYDITKWLSNSITRNIQSLDLKIYNGFARFELPNCVFSCKTLESLRLEGNILLDVPSHVCLPKLRTLELAGVVYQEHGNGSLISSSSSLESIVIENKLVSIEGCDLGFFIIDSNHNMLTSTLRHIKFINRFRWKNVMVPSNVFTLQTLEKLSLEGSFIISALPATISMPNLTLLELVEVKYKDDQILNRLISRCASLESLKVANKSMDAELEYLKLNISSRTLKVIELKLICYTNRGHKLVINAPALNYLKLNVEGRMIDCQIEDLAYLEQADISIHDSERGSSTLINVWQALRHVKSLKVYQRHYKVGVFGNALRIPMFHRLTELHITLSWYNSGVLPEFIMNSTTKLKNLTIQVMSGYKWRDPKSVPVCLLTSVRIVSITVFGGTHGETMLMTKYILGNARVLEKMEVCFLYCNDEEKVFKKIIKFSRASPKLSRSRVSPWTSLEEVTDSNLEEFNMLLNL